MRRRSVEPRACSVFAPATVPEGMFDLDRYLERIGLSGRPSLAAVHRAHVTSIPFENLDPHRGVPVSLETADLERKLVIERRGGYCFEHNLLLKAALQELGFEVESMLARVRVGSSPGSPGPRSHLVLRVRGEDGLWHADVGFGRGTLLAPIPFGPGVTHDQLGWRFRVVQDETELVLQTANGEQWIDLYGFVPEPAPFVDLEVSNWFTSTNPRSRFVTGLIVCVQHDDGSRAVLSDYDGLMLSEQSPARTVDTAVEWSDVPELLASRFGLRGFSLNGEHRLALSG
jgi:N-hydroxyarylamine O-acetyltransferase